MGGEGARANTVVVAAVAAANIAIYILNAENLPEAYKDDATTDCSITTVIVSIPPNDTVRTKSETLKE
jgi:hypothetical protein